MSIQIQLLIAVSVWTRLRHLGGVGLILLGLADSSVVPLPGSMDVLTIYLAARHHQLWWYYAVMATIGAVAGGYITYSLARKGGKEAFERKLSRKKAEKVFERFERWGFFAVAVPALLPPPFPIVPFLLAAGLCNTRARDFWQRWRWVAQFASPSLPDWEPFMAGTSSDSFRDITSRHCLRSSG